LDLNEKFCPICKNKNDRRAVDCIHCGASLEYHYWDLLVTATNPKALEKIPVKITDSLIDTSLIPDDGIAIYAAGTLKPVYLWFEQELMLGRKDDDEPFEGSLLDLSELGGYQAGISRRHALIRRMENGLEIVDLASTNGSWVNEEWLIPNKPIRLAGRSQLRFGRLNLLVLHRCSKTKRTGQLV